MFDEGTRGLRPSDFLLPFAITYSLPAQLPRRTPSKSRRGNRTFLTSGRRRRCRSPPLLTNRSWNNHVESKRRSDVYRGQHCRTNKSIAISRGVTRGCELIICAFAFPRHLLPVYRQCLDMCESHEIIDESYVRGNCEEKFSIDGSRRLAYFVTKIFSRTVFARVFETRCKKSEED